MSDQVQKFDYLDEHLPYMLGTLRYNFEKINQPQHFRDWNAYFESFAVNARNLAEYLETPRRSSTLLTPRPSTIGSKPE